MKTRVLLALALILAISFGYAALSAAQGGNPEVTNNPGSTTALPPAADEGPALTNNGGAAVLGTGPTAPNTVPPTSPATVYKTYSGTCFTPHGTESAFSQYAGGGGIYRTAGSSEFDCLLDLPHDARVTEIIFYVRDNSANTVNLWFATYQPDVGVYANIASTNTAGAQSSAIIQRKLSGSPITTIDNTRYQYLLEVGLFESTSTHAIFGARVGYVPSTVMLPIVRKDAN